ncbi:MAG TPA: hypothetical protein PKD10_16065 [Paracoccaceae bacterium]|nr:hypothetical protein [Paracoccaceae bacterium]
MPLSPPPDPLASARAAVTGGGMIPPAARQVAFEALKAARGQHVLWHRLERLHPWAFGAPDAPRRSRALPNCCAAPAAPANVIDAARLRALAAIRAAVARGLHGPRPDTASPDDAA